MASGGGGCKVAYIYKKNYLVYMYIEKKTTWWGCPPRYITWLGIVLGLGIDPFFLSHDFFPPIYFITWLFIGPYFTWLLRPFILSLNLFPTVLDFFLTLFSSLDFFQKKKCLTLFHLTFFPPYLTLFPPYLTFFPPYLTFFPPYLTFSRPTWLFSP